MESREQAASSKPSFYAAAVSPTALSNLLASCSLLICFLLPHSVGCDDRSHRPVALAAATVTQNAGASSLLALAAFWPYAFALATFAVMLGMVILRPAWFSTAMLALPVGTATGLTILWTFYLFGGRETSRMAMVIAATVVPVGTCVAARMLWLYREGRTTDAAAWGQGFFCVLAIFSLRWFWFPPVSRLLWGGLLSIASAILMMLASWTWGTRSCYDLFDRSVEPVPYQVSMRQLMIAIGLTAIALTYWRTLGHWD